MMIFMSYATLASFDRMRHCVVIRKIKSGLSLHPVILNIKVSMSRNKNLRSLTNYDIETKKVTRLETDNDVSTLLLSLN